MISVQVYAGQGGTNICVLMHERVLFNMPLAEWADVLKRVDAALQLKQTMDEIAVVEHPDEGSVWQHYNGNVYIVLFLTNVESTRPDEYPVTVTYQNAKNGKRYSRKLADWYRSMTRIDHQLTCAPPISID